MKTKHALLRAGICVMSFAFTWGQAFAGTETAPSEPPPEKVNPLSFADGKLVFDIEERLRYEFRENNYDFNSNIDSSTDDSTLLQRFRLGVKIKPTEWLTFYTQMQSSQEFFTKRLNVPGSFGAEGDVNFDFRNLYLEFANYKEFPVGLKIGRQILSYGDERLIGAFDWNNIGRTFDAIKIRVEQPDWNLDIFSSSVVTINRDVVNFSDFFNWDNTDRRMIFSGLYLTTKAVPKISLDLYLLTLNMKQGTNSSFEPTPGSLMGLAAGDAGGNPLSRTDFVTIGTRIKSSPKEWGGFDFDAELAMQVGRVQGLDLMAFASHSGIGYTFDAMWSPKIYAEYNYASGDSNPGDGDNNTFQNLFPTNHKFYGYMDLFAWENIHNPAFSISAKPLETVTVKLDYQMFWLATTRDAWYRANGLTRVRPVTPGADPYVGSEIDLTVKWQATSYLALEAGYSHFFAGGYVADTGVASDADFVYVQAGLKF